MHDDGSGRHAKKLSRLRGLLLGTAIGDSLGLPREGLSRQRAGRLFGNGSIEHSFCFGRGMASDDTEHTYLLATSWLRTVSKPQNFNSEFARALRWWLLALPAGLGSATLRSILKLWVGFSPDRSGVWSAGNGPAMRAAILGAIANDDPQRLRTLVATSSRMTHRDPRAEEGALTVALAAQFAFRTDGIVEPSALIAMLLENIAGDEMKQQLMLVRSLLAKGATPSEFASAAGFSIGVSGYVNQTVPAAIYCWLRYRNDFRAAVEAVIRLGGDTDSTAAITGALAGVSLGVESIPLRWIDRYRDWPISTAALMKLAEDVLQTLEQIENQSATGPFADRPCPKAVSPHRYWISALPRNLIFLTLVIAHGIRRLLPPY